MGKNWWADRGTLNTLFSFSNLIIQVKNTRFSEIQNTKVDDLLHIMEVTSSLRENEECSWTTEEVDLFYVALCKHKKDFSKISGELRNKSTQDCVEFYYMWKNLCREESQSFKNIINTDELPLPSEFL